MSYGCVVAPVSYGCSAPVYSGCAVVAPVVSYSGCAAVVSSGCAGGHLISSVVLSTSSGSGDVVVSGGTSNTGSSELTISPRGTKNAGNKDVATAEDDKLKPGTALSADEQRQLKEMLAAETDATEKKKLQDEFKKDSRVGRKATYEVFKKMKTGKDEVGATASIIVVVPDAAKVTIDGMSTVSTSSIRYFESPTLARGTTYSYTFAAEYQQDGQPVKVSKQVRFQAGKVVRLDLTSAPSAVASK